MTHLSVSELLYFNIVLHIHSNVSVYRSHVVSLKQCRLLFWMNGLKACRLCCCQNVQVCGAQEGRLCVSGLLRFKRVLLPGNNLTSARLTSCSKMNLQENKRLYGCLLKLHVCERAQVYSEVKVRFFR